MLSRRQVLTAGAAAALLSLHPASARIAIPERRIFLANPHTGEKFHDVYWAEGEYIPEALSQLNVLLRDHNTDEVITIAPELIDLVARLRARIGIAQPIQVTSAYRSPKTNAWVRRHNRHAAINSYHTKGMAVDIRVPGFNLAKLRRAAIMMQAGGVGSYSDASFIHLDVGPVRAW